jgi:hypothetical protein
VWLDKKNTIIRINTDTDTDTDYGRADHGYVVPIEFMSDPSLVTR